MFKNSILKTCVKQKNGIDQICLGCVNFLFEIFKLFL
jgi:hypothetical protein